MEEKMQKKINSCKLPQLERGHSLPAVPHTADARTVRTLHQIYHHPEQSRRERCSWEFYIYLTDSENINLRNVQAL